MTHPPRIDLEADFPTDFDAMTAADSTAAAEAGSVAPDEGAAAEAKVDAQPVVVIEYRNRGIPPVLMFPIALVVSLAMFAGYHYLVVRPKNQELQRAAKQAAQVAASLSAKEDAAADASKPARGSLDGLPLPLTLESQPLPPGFQLPPPNLNLPPPAATPSDPAPGRDDAAKPSDATVAETVPPKPVALPPAIGFARPGENPPAATPPEAEPKKDATPEIALAPKPDVVAMPPKPPADEPPPPSRDEMIQAIQNEAQAKAAKQEELLGHKEAARARVEAEARQRVEDERTAFRRALYDIVTTGGPDAGQRIDQLCNQFGRNYGDEIRDRVTAYLSRVHGRISRESEIRLLRTLGVPEPGILDFLANGVNRSINSRNGPRNPDEVRVTAAKQLLRSRPTPPTEVDAARLNSAIPRYPGR